MGGVNKVQRPNRRANPAGYLRWYREQHRALGLCLQCSSPALPNMSTCEKHRDYILRQQANRKTRWKQQGLCVICGTKAERGKTMCRLCLTSQESGRKERRAERLAQGMCADCGEHKAKTGKTRCKKCLAKRAQQAREYRSRVRIKRQRKLEWRRLWAKDPMTVAIRFEQLMRGRPRTEESA